MELRELTVNDISIIKDLFYGVFTIEPWNDDWTDECQLHSYLMDLIANTNSLSLGLFAEDNLIGMALGNIKHWYGGTEYCIEELCIKTKEQGKGFGTEFLNMVGEYVKKKGICDIFLQTDRRVPAYEFYKKNGFVELEDHVSLARKL